MLGGGRSWWWQRIIWWPSKKWQFYCVSESVGHSGWLNIYNGSVLSSTEPASAHHLYLYHSTISTIRAKGPFVLVCTSSLLDYHKRMLRKYVFFTLSKRSLILRNLLILFASLFLLYLLLNKFLWVMWGKGQSFFIFFPPSFSCLHSCFSLPDVVFVLPPSN